MGTGIGTVGTVGIYGKDDPLDGDGDGDGEEEEDGADETASVGIDVNGNNEGMGDDVCVWCGKCEREWAYGSVWEWA